MDIAITYCIEYRCFTYRHSLGARECEAGVSELSRVHHRIERKADRLNAVHISLRAIGFRSR